MKNFTVLIVFVLFTLISKNANAQAGVLDTSFNIAGIVTTDFGTLKDYGNAITLQTDGKIVVAGANLVSANNYQFILSRYFPDGSLDTTFGTAGKSFTNFSNSFESAYSVNIQTDGRIVATGFVDSSGYQFAVARYNTDGSLDTSFNSTGKVITNMNGSLGETAILQPDGKIIAGGGLWDFAIARYNQNGSLDSTFDSDGKVFTNFGTGGDKVKALAIQIDGKIVAGGYAPGAITDYDFALARYDTTGSLDTTFDNNGKVTIDINENSEDYGNSMAIQPDGKIILVGDFSNTANKDFAVVRVNSNGSIDSSFSNYGIATFDILNTDNYLTAMALQPDGKILLTGINYFGATDNIVLMRLETDGTVDNTFGNNGIVITTINNIYDESFAMTLQNDGKILLAGTAQFGADIDVAVLRYNNDIQTGIIDFAVANTQILVYPNPVKDAAIIQYTLSENENVTISLLDMNGRTVQTFFKDQLQLKGIHNETLHFNKSVSSGAYIISIANSQGAKGAAVKIMVE